MTTETMAKRDARVWRTTGPRRIVDGVAYRMKPYGWIVEATGEYVSRNAVTERWQYENLDRPHFGKTED